MDYSHIYFGKSLNDLIYNDVKLFFEEEKEENETIEFKSFHPQSNFDTDISNVIKGIDAFLNSEGGILIWGAPVGKKLENKKEKVFAGALAPLPILKEKDSLINLISGRITPLPIGIKVSILEKDHQYLYIFEVQPSPYKPHQFNDIYFVRLDGQSKPAPNYLIDALFKKITFPDVNGYIRFESIYNKGDGYLLNVSVFLSNFSKFQNEESASFQLVIYPGRISTHGGEYYSKEHSVLHFGRPLRDNLNIIIDFVDLEKFGYNVEFFLSFGGKYSPSKTSTYKLNLYNAQSTLPTQDANNLIVEYTENLLFHDYQDSLGKSKNTFIDDHIRKTSD